VPVQKKKKKNGVGREKKKKHAAFRKKGLTFGLELGK